MSEKNFSVRLSEERSNKVNAHAIKHHGSNKRFVENVIDNIAQVQRALDCVTAKPSRKR